jgi:23S rRNA (adenine2503-C2)-methyltransferase
MKTHFLDLPPEERIRWLRERGEPTYRERQVRDALPDLFIRGPLALSTWSYTLKELFFSEFDWNPFSAIEEFHDPEDQTVKFRLTLSDRQMIEMVLIPEGNRLTLCLSTQAGCAFRCAFCRTGDGGFFRHLLPSEIFGQWAYARAWARERWNRPISHLVFMGMGEPFHNYDHLIATLDLLTDPSFRIQYSPQRITVSTVGILPRLESFILHRRENLAISLHSARPELRKTLVPSESAYPIAEIRKLLLREKGRFSKRKLTAEVVLLSGVNDSLKDAQALALWCKGLPIRVNLIPYNPYPYGRFMPPSSSLLLRFQRILKERGIPVFIRKPRGRGVLAACGNLLPNLREE